MFARRLRIEHISADGTSLPCPLAWIDNFAMRNFTNEVVFDDTLPVADGVLEAGHNVPLDLLQEKMEAWFRRKQYLKAEDRLVITEETALPPKSSF